MASWRERLAAWQYDCGACPAIPAVAWLIAGILLGLGGASGLPGARLLAVGGTIGLLVMVRPRQLRWLSLFVPLGVVLACLQVASPWRTYPDHLPRDICHVRIRGVCVTPRDRLGQYTGFVCQIRSVSTWLSGDWQPARGKIMILRASCTPDPPEYGDLVELAGTITPPPTTSGQGTFDYRRYLWKQGIVHVIRPDQFTVTGRDRLRRVPAAAYAVRERLADALGRGIPDVRDRRLVQAMAFGYRKRLDGDLRDQFVRGGIIHVFAISGLHVGILALLATWYLCIVGVPLRLRGILLVLGVGAYVCMCGASASAVRAWLMLACWWGARLLRRPRVPLNVIAVAALLCLVWQPLSLLQTGFLFSFTVVAVLVYGWPLVSEWLLVLRERGAWLPRARRRDHGGRWRIWPAQAGATSLLAWSGSAGLVAASNGLLVPVGILLNLFVALLCTIILALAVVKIPLSLLGVGLADVSLGWLLGLCSWILRALAKLGGLPHASIRLAPPPALLVLGYYGLLLAILRQRRPTAWQPAALAVGVAALVIPTILGGAGPNGCRLVASDGSPAPAAILNGAGRGSATVVNTGGWAGARAVATTLTERGVSELDAIICTNGRWDTCGGVGTLLDHWPVATLVVPAHYRRSSTLREAVACQRKRGGRVRLLEAGAEPLRLGNLSVAVTGPTSEQEIRFLRAMGGREQPILALRGLPSGEVQVEPAATGAGDCPQTLRRSTCPTALFVPEP